MDRCAWYLLTSRRKRRLKPYVARISVEKLRFHGRSKTAGVTTLLHRAGWSGFKGPDPSTRPHGERQVTPNFFAIQGAMGSFFTIWGVRHESDRSEIIPIADVETSRSLLVAMHSRTGHSMPAHRPWKSQRSKAPRCRGRVRLRFRNGHYQKAHQGQPPP